MQLLCDSISKDKVVKFIPLLPHLSLDYELMFPVKNEGISTSLINGKHDWKFIKEHLEEEDRIVKKKELIKLIGLANNILNEGSLLYVQDTSR